MVPEAGEDLREQIMNEIVMAEERIFKLQDCMKAFQALHKPSSSQ